MLATDLRGIALHETAEAGWAASLRGSQPPQNLVGITYGSVVYGSVLE